MFFIQDFPQIGSKSKINVYKQNKDNLQKNANKAFQILSTHFNFNDNDEGQRYLRFWLTDNNGNIFPFLGTRIPFEKPKTIYNKNGNQKQILFRNIVVPYEKIFDNMFYPKEI